MSTTARKFINQLIIGLEQILVCRNLVTKVVNFFRKPTTAEYSKIYN